MALDPDDSRPPYRQVASALREAITTGRYAPGAKLPSRAQLAADYGVAPMTVQSALRELRGEGLVVSRQGSGVYVRVRTRDDTESRFRAVRQLLHEIHRSTGGDDPRCVECRDASGQLRSWPCRTREEIDPVLDGRADG
ncbi:GntR family transcriptional regulator [Actinosynnema sp. NPDC051121]